MTESADHQPRYHGDVLNCIRNGNGVYKYPDGGNNIYIYDGQWIKGKKSSYGKFTMKNTHQITSDFSSDGEITGMGVKVFADGRRYEGQFVNGEMHGKGIWISSNNEEIYDGDFQDNKREGFGILKLKVNNILNSTHSTSTSTSLSMVNLTSIFHGNFSLHKKNGFGTYLLPNILFLEAMFLNNYIQGTIILKFFYFITL